jgi:CRISPR/Cas system-associated exonuclease Cas4 (RecB family)
MRTLDLPSPADIARLASQAASGCEPPGIVQHITPLLHQDAQRSSRYSPTCSRAGQCPRMLSYWAMGVPPSDPTDPRMAMVFRTGDAVEEVVNSYIDRSGLHVTRKALEVRIPFRYGTIWGKVDRILEPDTIIDFKSANTYAYDEVTRTGPKPEHVAQVNLYIHGLRLAGRTGICKGLLFYVDKNNGAISEQPFRYSEELALACIRVFEAVHEAAMEGVPLPRPDGYSPGRAPCSYCSWRTTCWGVQQTDSSPAEADLSHLEDILRSYVELSKTRAFVESQMEDIRARVLAALADAGAAAGRAGPYTARVYEQTRTEVDTSLLPPLWVAAATTTKTYQVLRIQERKNGKKEEHGT